MRTSMAPERALSRLGRFMVMIITPSARSIKACGGTGASEVVLSDMVGWPFLVAGGVVMECG